MEERIIIRVSSYFDKKKAVGGEETLFYGYLCYYFITSLSIPPPDDIRNLDGFYGVILLIEITYTFSGLDNLFWIHYWNDNIDQKADLESAAWNEVDDRKEGEIVGTTVLK